MKNIKTFESYIKLYEELDPNTYSNAADKLKKAGHIKRAENMNKYADLMHWKKYKEDFSKYNVIIEVDLVNIKDGDSIIKCYPEIDFGFVKDVDFILISLIPIDENDLRKMAKYTKDFYDVCNVPGIFKCYHLSKNKSNETVLGKWWNDHGIEIANRNSAAKLKKLMIDILLDEIPNYPTYNQISDDKREDMLEIVNNLPINKMYKN